MYGEKHQFKVEDSIPSLLANIFYNKISLSEVLDEYDLEEVLDYLENTYGFNLILSTIIKRNICG